MAFNLFKNAMSGAMDKKLAPESVVPPPKVPASGAGMPGFLSKPVKTAEQDVKAAKKAGIFNLFNLQYGTSSKGNHTIFDYGPLAKQGDYDPLGGVKMPTEGSGTQNKENGATGAFNPPQNGSQTGSQSMQQNTVPGGLNPASFLTQIQNNSREFGLRGNAPLQQFNVGNRAGNVSQFNAGLASALNTPLVAGLEATLPQQQGLTSTLYNPVTGEQLAGASNQLGNRSVQAGAVGEVQNQVGQYFSTKQNLANFDQQSNLLNNLISGGILVNATGIPIVNQLQQKFNNNIISSSNYNKYKAALAEIGRAYGGYLASAGGTTPTLAGVQQDDVINGNITPQQLQEVIGFVKEQGRATLSAMEKTIKQVQQTANTGHLGTAFD